VRYEKVDKNASTYKLEWNNEFEQAIPTIIVNRQIQKGVAIERLANEENEIVD
jgi:hypothetical protein